MRVLERSAAARSIRILRLTFGETKGSANVEEEGRREASGGIYTPSSACRPHISDSFRCFGTGYLDGGVGKTIPIRKVLFRF